MDAPTNGAVVTANNTVSNTKDVSKPVEKDEIIKQLANENQLLIWKVAELEDIIEGWIAKSDALEEKIAALTQTNIILRDKLDSKPPPRKSTGPDQISKKPLPPLPIAQSTSNPSSASNSPRLDTSSLPPSDSPPSPSPLSTPSSPDFTNPLSCDAPDEAWGIMAGGKGMAGWNSGSVVKPAVPERDKLRTSAMLSQSSSMTVLPIATEYAARDTRRSKTAPIPTSPILSPPYLARAISLSSPAFPDGDLTTPGSPEPVVESEEESTGDLILAKNEETGKTFVKGGTLDKLIERLAYDKTPETDYQLAFLLTYRSFTTPMELLEKLIARYNIELTNGDEKRKKIIQLRVGNVIKMWVDKHFHDFGKDANLVSRVTVFLEGQLVKDMETVGRTISKLLTHQRGNITITFPTPPPATLQPKTSDFNEFEPLEVARQLTLIEFDLYKGIEAKECLNQGWNKGDKEERAPHIVAMIKRFNLVSNWVATEIVTTEKLTDRISKVKKFLNIAKCCREVGNFNGIMEILAGLQNSAVHRLKKTWEKVLAKTKYDELYNGMLTLMSNNGNFKDYRAALHNCHPPCIPYLGVFLTDLTFIEDGTKDNLNGRDELINFEKRRKVSVVIGDIQQYQQTPYNLSTENTIKDSLLNLGTPVEENTLYKHSMACEPRETNPPAATTPRVLYDKFTMPSFLTNLTTNLAK